MNWLEKKVYMYYSTDDYSNDVHINYAQERSRPMYFDLRLELFKNGKSEECHIPSLGKWRPYLECALRRNQRMEYMIPMYPLHQIGYKFHWSRSMDESAYNNYRSYAPRTDFRKWWWYMPYPGWHQSWYIYFNIHIFILCGYAPIQSRHSNANYSTQSLCFPNKIIIIGRKFVQERSSSVMSSVWQGRLLLLFYKVHHVFAAAVAADVCYCYACCGGNSFESCVRFSKLLILLFSEAKIYRQRAQTWQLYALTAWESRLGIWLLAIPSFVAFVVCFRACLKLGISLKNFFMPSRIYNHTNIAMYLCNIHDSLISRKDIYGIWL